MAALDQGKIVLIVGGLAALLLMTLGLIWMAVVLTRRAQVRQRLVDAAWDAVRQRLGLTASVPSIYERALDGQYRGRPLSIYAKSGRAENSSYTHVAVSEKFQADIYVQAIDYRTMGTQYRPAGDAELDRRYFFQAQPDELLGRLLANPGVRQLLLESQVRWLHVTPYEVRCSVRGIEKDAQRLNLMIDLVSAAADAVGREVRSLGAGPPRAPEEYMTYGAKRITGTAARLLVGLFVLLTIACAVGIVVLAPRLFERL
jgi:hypothetical protein